MRGDKELETARAEREQVESGGQREQAAEGGQGHVVLIEGMLADITERQKAERERQRAEEAENRLARLRLQALRYQINPHFLFNILNSVDALAKQAPERIPDLILELANYLRFALTDHEGGLIPLSFELDAITSYLKLEKVRFEEDLAVEIVASPEAGEALVPELLIQPMDQPANCASPTPCFWIPAGSRFSCVLRT